ncbi:MAG: tetratricopeptide repeat protein [Deltaproteobacteria bacterium]|nr:tetratricopeptide repeat protein [Deltaproteobacteria bacterium]MBI3388604.1 tetratricopeptide repeat protein [Deltaproteobacteria bacterium]
MIPGMPPSLLSELSERIATQMGLHFPPERWHDLEQGLRLAARELEFPSLAMCAQWLLATPLTKAQIAVLAGHLTVGETYFLRDDKLFAILEHRVVPELIRDRRATGQRLRIWSAGCCTGEEPYSLAILLSRLLPDWRAWNITILGTDINPGFLRKAAAGVYGQWSFRNEPPWLQHRCFHARANGRFEILDEIKAAVTFSPLNLAEDTYPSLLTNTNAMDVILCRNVLMYFSHERAFAVARNLYRSLVDGGWLIVAPSETSPELFSQFQTVRCDGATLYRKDTARLPAADEASRAASVFPLPDPQPTPTRSAIAWPQPVTAAKAADSLEAPYARAVALYGQGRYEDAAATLRALCADSRGPPAALALLARTYANQGHLVTAQEWADKAIAADKLNAGLHFLLATIVHEEGDSEAAVRSLERALYLDQNFVLAHFTLGNLTMRQGKALRARKHFENTVALLSRCPPDEVLPESEGLTAGRLMDIVRTIGLEDAP